MANTPKVTDLYFRFKERHQILGERLDGEVRVTRSGRRRLCGSMATRVAWGVPTGVTERKKDLIITRGRGGLSERRMTVLRRTHSGGLRQIFNKSVLK